MSFITDDFILSNKTAKTLYFDHAADQPIFDYHCHLVPQDLAANRRYGNLYELWLEGDHYKWRAMRTNGVDEKFCTGDADPFDKYMAWAQTVPHTLRNPLYHWTHLELKRYFGIDKLLGPDTAKEIWDQANEQLDDMTPAKIFQRFKVAMVGTTDDPTDSLEHHQKIADDDLYPDTVVYPSFRPDKAHALADGTAFNAYVQKLEAAADTKCDTLSDLLGALKQRHDFFHQLGGRISDHGLTHIPAATCSREEAEAIYLAARNGKPTSTIEQDKFTVYLLTELAQWDNARKWTQQFHVGAMRNNNAWAWEHLGPDTGFDSIGDFPQGQGLSRLLGRLAGQQKLPKTILYNLNPRDNYLFATMVGNFQGAGDPDNIPGKVQFGSGWWFLDQLEGMTWQINAVSNLGLLSRFVGMLTDSRSVLSYVRHEYFRRLLCDLIGRDVESGQLPDDTKMLGAMVEDICFNNAKNYFGATLKGKYA